MRRWAKPDHSFKQVVAEHVQKCIREHKHKLDAPKAKELGKAIYNTIVQREVEVRALQGRAGCTDRQQSCTEQALLLVWTKTGRRLHYIRSRPLPD